MPYCTTTDVERKAGGAERLKLIADWDGDGEADDEVIRDAIDEVSGRVDSYAGKVRAVAFAEPIPPIIRWTVAAEVVWEIRNARETVTDPAQVALHEERVAWLKALAKGEVTLGVTPPPAAATGAEYGERDSDPDMPNIRSDYGGFY